MNGSGKGQKAALYEEYVARGGTKKFKSFDSTAQLKDEMKKLPPLPEGSAQPEAEADDKPAPKKPKKQDAEPKSDKQDAEPKSDEPKSKKQDADEVIDAGNKAKKPKRTAKEPKAPKERKPSKNPNTQARVNRLAAHCSDAHNILMTFAKSDRVWEFTRGGKKVATCDSKRLADFTVDHAAFDKWIKRPV